jgi:uncharacterized protein
MTLHETIKKGIVEAMKAKDQTRLQTFRSLSAAMTNEVVAKKRRPDDLLTDEEALAVLKRAANQRKDSIQQYEAAGRQELADPEKAELAVIEALLPAQMSRERIEEVVRRKMTETGTTNASGAGKLTGAVMQELKGQADGGLVKEVVDSLLA